MTCRPVWIYTYKAILRSIPCFVPIIVSNVFSYVLIELHCIALLTSELGRKLGHINI